MKDDAAAKFRPNRRYLLLVVLFVLAIYVVVPQLGDFKESWTILKHPVAGWVILAIIFTALTYLAAAATYCYLAFKPLAYGKTVLMQFAAMFVNRLLPAGVGALGANYLYLKRNKHTPAQATSIVAVNNLLGFIGNTLVVVILLLALPGSASSMMHDHNGSGSKWLGYAVGALAIGLIAGLFVGRRRVKKALLDVGAQLLEYRHRPWGLAWALLASIILTLANVTALYFCALALGVHLSLTAVMLIFNLGVGAGTAAPTPGGLGGFEAGLVGGFIAYHVDGSTALAVAILYRLISYWLALIVGAAAFVVAQRRHYI